jgi:ABC-2 type transport system ATP-binding protein
MAETVLEVLCDQPQEAMEGIEKLPGVQEASLFGQGLHVVVVDEPAAAGGIRRYLDERGFRLDRLERITPSLEDVFVSLIEARDRQDQPQREVRR